MKEGDRFHTAYGFLTTPENENVPIQEQGPHSDAHCLTSKLFFSEFRVEKPNSFDYSKMEDFFNNLVETPANIEDILGKELQHKEANLAPGVTKVILKGRATRFNKHYKNLHDDLKSHFSLKDDYYKGKSKNDKKDKFYNKSGTTSAKMVALKKLRAIIELHPQHTYAYQGGGKATPAELGGKGESHTLSKFLKGDFEQITKLVDLPKKWKYLDMDRFYLLIKKKLLRLYKPKEVNEIIGHLKNVPAKI